MGPKENIGKDRDNNVNNLRMWSDFFDFFSAEKTPKKMPRKDEKKIANTAIFKVGLKCFVNKSVTFFLLNREFPKSPLPTLMKKFLNCWVKETSSPRSFL